MDILDLINSQEIAEHCRAIGQTWTAFEAAVIIGRSIGGFYVDQHTSWKTATIAIRHDAWRNLIDNSADMPTFGYYKYPDIKPVYSGFHEKLKETIMYDELVAALIEKEEENAIYKIHGESPNKNFKRLSKIYMKDNCILQKSDDEEKPYFILDENAKKYFPEDDYNTLYQDIDFMGNPVRYFASREISNKYFPDVDYDNVTETFVKPYVYIPNPSEKWNTMLSGKERSLLYKILFILDVFDPLCLKWMPTTDEYLPEAWEVFQILKNGGGEKGLNDYWEEFIKEMTGYKDDPELKHFKEIRKELTEKLLKLIKEK